MNKLNKHCIFRTSEEEDKKFKDYIQELYDKGVISSNSSSQVLRILCAGVVKGHINLNKLAKKL